MSFSNHETPADTNPPNPAESSIIGSLDQMSSTIHRSILGIPDENDEYNRGLIFHSDLSTGQPSVYSTSGDSKDPGENTPYEPSQSSNNTGSHVVLTPQSISDASGSLHRRLASSTSGGSSEGGFSDCGIVREHWSISAHASTGASQAAHSPIPSQTPTYTPMVGSFTATTTSLAPHPPLSESFCPPAGMTDPQAIINITWNDVEYLGEIISSDNPSRGHQIDLIGAQFEPSASSQSEIAQTPEAVHGKRTGTRSKKLAIRTQRVSRPRPDPTRPRASPKNATWNATSPEDAKAIRQVGSCLQCLVNHEKVSN